MKLTREYCPVCDYGWLIPFLHRRGVPAHQNLIVSSQVEATSIQRGDLQMVVCEGCGFIFNAAFDPSKLAYGSDYDNTQACSPFFQSHLEHLVSHLVKHRNVRNSRIVEVGCGKGNFLKALIDFPDGGNQGIGFDPSYVGAAEDREGRLVFHRRFYDADCTDFEADVVVCRHVIEHVDQPLTLLRAVRNALGGKPGARVFFETPCAEWILRGKVIWDFFYEHCSLFTANSLRTAFEATEFEVSEVTHLFGGQYLWLEARAASVPTTVTRSSGEIPFLARDFGRAESELTNSWKGRIQELRAKGKVALWGAGAKGATFANLVDPNHELIDSVVDLNPAKQGHYVPGTGHPVIAYEALPSRGVKSVILMNPNYRLENVDLLERAKINVDLFDWR